jgi:Ni/Co efflux regulator RcnB
MVSGADLLHSDCSGLAPRKVSGMKKLLMCLVLAGFTLPTVLPAQSGQEQSQQQTKKNRKKKVKRAKKSKKTKSTAKSGPAA